MRIETHAGVGGDIIVSISLTKLDMMAHDRIDKLLNYVLMQAGDIIAKELVEKYHDEIDAKITPDKILAIVTEKIKGRISILSDK